MDRRLQERLVGAATLALLAVVFLPMLLDRGGARMDHTEIPPRPRMEAAVDAAAPRPAPWSQSQEPPQAREPRDEPQSPPRKKWFAAAPPPEQQTAWAVQTGSFSKRDNAEELNRKLRAHDYPAYVRSARAANGETRYQVRVGPELLRADAEKLQEKLRRAMSLDGIVIAYP